MRSYSNKFEVTFVLGKVSATVSLPLRDITTWDIIKYLNFSTEQQSSIIITGLMDLKTKQIIPMKKHETLHRLGFIEDPRERLKNGATYQVMIEDVRDPWVQKLSDKEKKQIRDRFNVMDENGDGVITWDDIVKYYNKKKEEEIELFKRLTERRIQKHPNETARWEKNFEEMKKIVCYNTEASIKHFKSLDVDNNGVISWDEFLNYEAKLSYKINQQQYDY